MFKTMKLKNGHLDMKIENFACVALVLEENIVDLMFPCNCIEEAFNLHEPEFQLEWQIQVGRKVK